VKRFDLNQLAQRGSNPLDMTDRTRALELPENKVSTRWHLLPARELRLSKRA
jgi:hypothetical protein